VAKKGEHLTAKPRTYPIYSKYSEKQLVRDVSTYRICSLEIGWKAPLTHPKLTVLNLVAKFL